MQQNEKINLSVGLEGRSYPILIGSNLVHDIEKCLNEVTQSGNKAILVFDEGFHNVINQFGWEFVNNFPSLVLPSGETTKSVEYLSKLWSFFSEQCVDRTSTVFAIGGGVIGDLCGFASASFLRGINFYQIPTTLLAMVDSSVGGKTGINLKAGKNLVGAFHQPKGVFVDLSLLKTLPKREFSAGMAEVIKYGLLGNKGLFKILSDFPTPICSKSSELSEIIKICCSDKAKIVEEDETESISSSGGRALLNLGHTFAHAIEAVAGYGEYLHGEAVSIGLVSAFRLSKLCGFCLENDEGKLVKILNSYNLPVRLINPLDTNLLINAMQADKKVSSGILRFVLLREIGEAFVTNEVGIEIVSKVWRSVGAT